MEASESVLGPLKRAERVERDGEAQPRCQLPGPRSREWSQAEQEALEHALRENPRRSFATPTARYAAIAQQLPTSRPIREVALRVHWLTQLQKRSADAGRSSELEEEEHNEDNDDGGVAQALEHNAHLIANADQALRSSDLSRSTQLISALRSSIQNLEAGMSEPSGAQLAPLPKRFDSALADRVLGHSASDPTRNALCNDPQDGLSNADQRENPHLHPAFCLTFPQNQQQQQQEQQEQQQQQQQCAVAPHLLSTKDAPAASFDPHINLHSEAWQDLHNC